MQEQTKTPEFSRVVEFANLAPLGTTMTITAEADECAAVATRLELVGLNVLSARITLEPWRGRGWRVSGTVEGEVEQLCVVTADEFVSACSFKLERCFLGQKDRQERNKAIDLDPLSEDEPDVIVDDRIDIGELVVEELALTLDPYPRKPGALYAGETAEDVADDKANPFAVLANLNRPE